MNTLFTVWLVIRIGILGQPMVTVVDVKEPDLDTCQMEARRALDKAVEVGKDFKEFFATCSIELNETTPADTKG